MKIKAHILLIVVLTIQQTDIYGQNNIGGVLSSDTTLALANSPYVVTNNLLVQQSVKVIVEAGVQLLFNQGIYLQVDGELQALGTSVNPITFTKNNTATNWAGIKFSPTSVDYDTITGNGSILTYCVIEHTYDVSSIFDAITVNSTNPEISNCEIRNFDSGVYLQGAVRFLNNKIHDGNWRLLYSNGTDSLNPALISGNEIYNYPGNNGAAVTLRNTKFINNYIHDIGDVTAVIIMDNGEVSNNLFANNSNVGLVIVEGTNPTITCNTFLNNRISVVMTCERHPNFINNNFLDYQDYHVYWTTFYFPFNNNTCTLPPGSGTYATVDFSNNYWGGLTNSQIDSAIWDFNDDFSNKVLINYSPVLNDTVNTIGCSSITLLGLKDSNIGHPINIRVYPNPFSDFTIMEFENTRKEKSILTIYNTIGQLVRQIDNISNGQIRIERGNLTNGLYFFQLRTDSEIVGNKKLIIE